MEKADFEDFLKNRYRDQIRWYDEKSIWNKKMYNCLQFSLIILSALTPVLIGVGFIPDLGLGVRILPVVTSVIVTVLALVLTTYQFQENWITYRTTCETLKKEEYFYKASVGDYSDTEDREGLFVQRVESLISRENTMWLTSGPEKGENLRKE